MAMINSASIVLDFFKEG